ncbi:MAG TPA: hypothetical protein VFH51_09900, partial [Myxococcota bacterium]|nr:hypothetical protein [Myxococcota bacterium]
MAPLATAFLSDPPLEAYVLRLKPIAGCKLHRSDLGALIDVCLETLFLAPVRQAALLELALQAARLGLGGATVNLEANTLTLVRTAERPCTMEFELRPTPTGTAGSRFLGLRVWTPGVSDAARAELARLAQPCFAQALVTVREQLNVCPARDLAIFSADSNAHLTQRELLTLFGHYGFDWATAKHRVGLDATRHPVIEILEDSIGRETGRPFTFATEFLGEAQMWCLNDLRWRFFFEPALRAAAREFDRALAGVLNASADRGAPPQSVHGRWTGPTT